MQAGYMNGLLQAGAVPATLLLPTGKAKGIKGVPLIKNLLPILLLNKQDEKSFRGADFGLDGKY